MKKTLASFERLNLERIVKTHEDNHARYTEAVLALANDDARVFVNGLNSRSDYEAQIAELAAVAEDTPPRDCNVRLQEIYRELISEDDAGWNPAIDGDLRPAPGRRNKEIDG
tara:strand:- start:17 stop:352 length:336 start_codon:yes stop_codon:yes gene_type:complete